MKSKEQFLSANETGELPTSGFGAVPKGASFQGKVPPLHFSDTGNFWRILKQSVAATIVRPGHMHSSPRQSLPFPPISQLGDLPNSHFCYAIDCPCHWHWSKYIAKQDHFRNHQVIQKKEKHQCNQ